MSDNQRTPLYDRHVAHGARVVPFAGWDMPVQYTGIIDEHKAVRTAVGMFDVSHMARLMVTGPDAFAFIDSVFTNNVATMKDGQVRYGLVCNEAGFILDDILVTKYPDHLGICVNAGNHAKIVDWFKLHLLGGTENRKNWNANLTDLSSQTVMIAVQGPKAVAACQALIADDITAMKYYFAKHSKYRDQPCVVSRTGYTGEDGYELVVQNALAVHLWNDLLDKGVVPCGLGSRDTLRLEAAMPLYGHELNETINPIQAKLGWAVKLDKTDFVGKTALVNAPKDAPVRVGLELQSKRAAREGSTILNDGQTVGTVTSGSFVPYLQKSIAMGYVPPALSDLGTTLMIDLKGTQIPANVVPLPFYQRAK